MENNKKLEYLKFEEFRRRAKEQAQKDREEREARIKEHWNNLPRFEKPDDVPEIPKVDPEEYKKFYVPKLIAAGAIPKKDLVDDQCYLGQHRRATIAKWNAQKNVFEYWRHKFGQVYLDVCNHFEDDDGYALFVPIKLVTQEDFDKTKWSLFFLFAPGSKVVGENHENESLYEIKKFPVILFG